MVRQVRGLAMIAGFSLLLATASAQTNYLPPPYVLYALNSSGVALPVPGTGTAQALSYVPPAFLAYCLNGSTAVPCSFAGSGGSFTLTTSNTSGPATLVNGVLNIPIYQSIPTTATSLASSSTVAPLSLLVELTGTAQVNTISLPASGWTGCIDWIVDSVLVFSATGNVAKGFTTTAGARYRGCYLNLSDALWHF